MKEFTGIKKQVIVGREGYGDDDASKYMTFKAWAKGDKKRVYMNDYKGRTIGYIDVNEESETFGDVEIINRQGLSKDDIDATVDAFTAEELSEEDDIIEAETVEKEAEEPATRIEKNGKLVAENDVYDGCIYLYSVKTYLLNNELWKVEAHPNLNRYTGENCVERICDDVRAELRDYGEEYWKVYNGLDAVEYKKLVEMMK